MSVSNGGRAVDQLAADTGRAEILCCQSSGGVTLRYTGPFFHEFLLDMPKSEAVLAALEQAGILGGLPVDSGILWCATEKASKEALDQTIAIVKEVLAQ